MQTAFDGNLTVNMRGVFLDISKAFDKVWHNALIFKFESYGTEGEFFYYLKFIFTIENKGLYEMDKHLSGKEPIPEFRKDQY